MGSDTRKKYTKEASGMPSSSSSSSRATPRRHRKSRSSDVEIDDQLSQASNDCSHDGQQSAASSSYSMYQEMARRRRMKKRRDRSPVKGGMLGGHGNLVFILILSWIVFYLTTSHADRLKSMLGMATTSNNNTHNDNNDNSDNDMPSTKLRGSATDDRNNEPGADKEETYSDSSEKEPSNADPIDTLNVPDGQNDIDPDADKPATGDDQAGAAATAGVGGSNLWEGLLEKNQVDDASAIQSTDGLNSAADTMAATGDTMLMQQTNSTTATTEGNMMTTTDTTMIVPSAGGDLSATLSMNTTFDGAMVPQGLMQQQQEQSQGGVMTMAMQPQTGADGQPMVMMQPQTGADGQQTTMMAPQQAGADSQSMMTTMQQTGADGQVMMGPDGQSMMPQAGTEGQAMMMQQAGVDGQQVLMQQTETDGQPMLVPQPGQQSTDGQVMTGPDGQPIMKQQAGAGGQAMTVQQGGTNGQATMTMQGSVDSQLAVQGADNQIMTPPMVDANGNPMQLSSTNSQLMHGGLNNTMMMVGDMNASMTGPAGSTITQAMNSGGMTTGQMMAQGVPSGQVMMQQTVMEGADGTQMQGVEGQEIPMRQQGSTTITEGMTLQPPDGQQLAMAQHGSSANGSGMQMQGDDGTQLTRGQYGSTSNTDGTKMEGSDGNEMAMSQYGSTSTTAESMAMQAPNGQQLAMAQYSSTSDSDSTKTAASDGQQMTMGQYGPSTTSSVDGQQLASSQYGSASSSDAMKMEASDGQGSPLGQLGTTSNVDGMETQTSQYRSTTSSSSEGVEGQQLATAQYGASTDNQIGSRSTMMESDGLSGSAMGDGSELAPTSDSAQISGNQMSSSSISNTNYVEGKSQQMMQGTVSGTMTQDRGSMMAAGQVSQNFGSNSGTGLMQSGNAMVDGIQSSSVSGTVDGIMTPMNTQPDQNEFTQPVMSGSNLQAQYSPDQLRDTKYGESSGSRLRRRLMEALPTDFNVVEYVQKHEWYKMLLNVDEDLPFQSTTQTPYFWHIHKSGGSTMKHLMTCLNRTQTRRIDVPNCSDQEDMLKICVLEWGNIVNCDASSLQGIERIRKLRLVERNVPNLVVDTSRVYEATTIFESHRRGRLFMVLRDPVERAISKYYYTKIATWERNYKPEMANMTMTEFANSRYCYENWVTRRLVNKMSPDLQINDQDLTVAKEILRQKALILLTRNLSEGVERLVQYFGWPVSDYQRSCVNKFAVEEPVNSNPHPIPPPDSEDYQAIRARNMYDVELYEYALQLYEAQGAFLQQMPQPSQ